MSDTKKYYWLKLKRDFFKRHDVTVIEAMQNGDKYLLFYMKLLVESIDHEGALRFSDTVPYNDSMLSAITHTDIDIVRSAVKVFQQFGMMDMMDDGTLYLNQVETMIGDETAWAEKKRLYREKQKLIETDEGQKRTLSDKSIELEKEIDKDNIPEKPISEKIGKKQYSEEKNILLSQKEYDTLKSDLGSELTERCIEYLSAYKLEKAYKTKSDYLTIRRWVVEAVKKQPYSKPLNVKKKRCPSCGGEIFNSTCRNCGVLLDAKGEILS